MAPSDTRINIYRLFSIILFVSVVLPVCSCTLTRPTEMVILNPSTLEKLPEPRPWLFARYNPLTHREHIVELNTPSGVAYLVIGPGLAATYNNALGAFFNLNQHTTKGAGQLAFTHFNMLRFESEARDLSPAASGLRRSRLRLGLSHYIRIVFPEGDLLEEIPVNVSLEGVFEYDGMEDFTAKAGLLAADMLQKLERELLDYLVENDYKGKYRYHGGLRPAVNPGTP